MTPFPEFDIKLVSSLIHLKVGLVNEELKRTQTPFYLNSSINTGGDEAPPRRWGKVVRALWLSLAPLLSCLRAAGSLFAHSTNTGPHIWPVDLLVAKWNGSDTTSPFFPEVTDLNFHNESL